MHIVTMTAKTAIPPDMLHPITINVTLVSLKVGHGLLGNTTAEVTCTVPASK